jgi:methionyl-tRNA formyltransferase
MLKNLRIAILTQEDSFVIPQNIKLIGDLEITNLVAIVKINSTGSLENKKMLFVRGFSFFQVLKLGLLSGINRICNYIDCISFYRLGFLKSLKSVSVKLNTEYKTVIDPNQSSLHDWLKTKDLDLIVSFSAPCIFNSQLLNLPRFGCINLHCSTLPKYAGLLPSFWAIYEKSETVGATVHKMDDKIDNGAILGQFTIPIPARPSMFKVIRQTKQLGGYLMVSVINDILCGNVTEQSNKINSEDYFSWPTIEQIKEFRRNGGRLI